MSISPITIYVPTVIWGALSGVRAGTTNSRTSGDDRSGLNSPGAKLYGCVLSGVVIYVVISGPGAPV